MQMRGYAHLRLLCLAFVLVSCDRDKATSTDETQADSSVEGVNAWANTELTAGMTEAEALAALRAETIGRIAGSLHSRYWQCQSAKHPKYTIKCMFSADNEGTMRLESWEVINTTIDPAIAIPTSQYHKDYVSS